MTKIYTILSLMLFVACFQSCKKNNSIEKDDSNKVSVVSKITFQYSPTQKRVEEYIYDNERRVLKSRTENYSTTPAGQWETYTYEYDSNNRLTKAVLTNVTNQVQGTQVFVYNYNTVAGEQIYFETRDGVQVAVVPISLDANGRVIFVKKRYGLKYDAQGNFTYFGAPEGMNDWNATIQWDDKKNPFHNVVGLNPNFNYLVELYPIQTPHNLLTINNVGKTVITYNKEDLPVNSTHTGSDGSKTIIDYEYIKM